MTSGRLRPVWAEVDLGAIAHNAGVIRSLVAPTELCAVVKASGYGHGSVQVAEAAAKAVAASGTRTMPLPVHVKVDTGMHRVGAAPDVAAAVARAVATRTELELQGLYTHFAVADEPDRDDVTAGQLALFQRVA